MNLAIPARLVFGRPTRIRRLAPGPHAGTYSTAAHRIERPDGAVLEGWSAVPTAGAPTGVILYFGGRNENVAWAPDIASFAAGHAVYAFNYRGFGASTGRPSEQRAKLDAQALHRYVTRRESAASLAGLAIVGRSLGTSIALWLAREAAPRRLVLMSPFESVRHVLGGRPGWRAVAPFVAPFIAPSFDCRALAAAYAGEALLLLAEHDTSVAHDQSLRLGARLARPPLVRVVPGTTHRSLPRSTAAQAALAAFLSS